MMDGIAALKQIRVLHVLGAFEHGGIQTWLLHVLRHIDRECFHLDFVVKTQHPAAHDDEVLALGSKIIFCDMTNPVRFAHSFCRVLRGPEKYDIVHSHTHHFSGYVLSLARLCGAPGRIAHSHNDTRHAERANGIGRQGYLGLMKCLLRSNATLKLACSRRAAEDLFGSGWAKDEQCRILHYGIATQSFFTTVNRGAERREFGFESSDFIVGHVGRFAPQKNHQFVLAVFRELASNMNNAKLLLVGNGTLEQDIRRAVGEMGLEQRVSFAGSRRDIPRLMKNVMDVLLLPSFHEGLPLVLIESQAARLPAVISDTITEEATVETELISRMSLTDSAADWAAMAATTGNAFRTRRSAGPPESLLQSDFNIEHAVRELECIYE
ncbi:MAG TPA: glycosyltransferase, partial [Oligoflexia bacterium]|nr:glycosyltransferase [Oligoflexia bacterium]